VPKANAKSYSRNTSSLSRWGLGRFKMIKCYERNNWSFHFGYLIGVGLGFQIDRNGWDLDLVKFYIGMEW
jgi:hypothetical protein